MTYDHDVEEALRRNGIAVSSRISALAIYGYMGLVVGVFIMLGGAPGLLEEVYGPMIRYWLGGSCFLGGVFLMTSAVRAGRSSYGGWWSGLFGTLIFAGWTTALAITYAKIGIDRGFVIPHFGETIPSTSPRPYVPFLYQSISFLALLHLVTLLRLGRKPR